MSCTNPRPHCCPVAMIPTSATGISEPVPGEHATWEGSVGAQCQSWAQSSLLGWEGRVQQGHVKLGAPLGAALGRGLGDQRKHCAEHIAVQST